MGPLRRPLKPKLWTRPLINKRLDDEMGSIEEWLDSKELFEAESVAEDGMTEFYLHNADEEY